MKLQYVIKFGFENIYKLSYNLFDFFYHIHTSTKSFFSYLNHEKKMRFYSVYI